MFKPRSDPILYLALFPSFFFLAAVSSFPPLWMADDPADLHR